MCGIFCLPQGFEGLPEDRAPWCGVPHDTIHQTLLWDLQNKPRRGSIALDIHAFVSVGSTSETPLFVFTCALLRLPDGRKPQVKGVYAFQKDEPNTSDKGWERRIIRRSCDGLLLGVGVDCHIVQPGCAPCLPYTGILLHAVNVCIHVCTGCLSLFAHAHGAVRLYLGKLGRRRHRRSYRPL